MTDEQIRTRLRDRADALGLGRTELARRAGMSQGNVSALLGGSRPMGWRSLRRLAEALNLRIELRPDTGGKG